MGKKRGRAAKNAQKVRGKFYEEPALTKAPHSFIISRGNCGKNAHQLVDDLRKVMSPYTASHLKVKRKNVLRDYVNVAGSLHVTHVLALSRPHEHVNLQVVRLPRGPTLTFKVRGYTFMKDVLSALKKPTADAKQYQMHPLLVMNGFKPAKKVPGSDSRATSAALKAEEQVYPLMTSIFQNMFPAINVNSVRLDNIRRCVLLTCEPGTKTVEFRHYAIRARPQGVSRSVKKLTKSRVPNMGECEDISEFVLRQGGATSDSEADLDGPPMEVELPQRVGKFGAEKSVSAIRLTEIGPRLTMDLYKVEQGVAEGEVLYHAYISMSAEEAAQRKAARDKQRQLKILRRKQQEANVKRKEEEKQAHKAKSMLGIDRKRKETEPESNTTDKKTSTSGGGPVEATNSDDEWEDDMADADDENSDADDDAAWYKAEVGSAPDKDLLPGGGASAGKRKRPLNEGRGRRGNENKKAKTGGGKSKMAHRVKEKAADDWKAKKRAKDQDKRKKERDEMKMQRTQLKAFHRERSGGKGFGKKGGGKNMRNRGGKRDTFAAGKGKFHAQKKGGSARNKKSKR